MTPTTLPELSKDLAIYVNHDRDNHPLMTVETANIELAMGDDGLYVAIQVPENWQGQKALAAVRCGRLSGLSVGSLSHKFAEPRFLCGGIAYEKSYSHDMLIDEISLTGNPSFKQTHIRVLNEAASRECRAELIANRCQRLGQYAERKRWLAAVKDGLRPQYKF
ncbi:MAG: HK97 family phage prohead protease [Pirellulales bacterium]|nr:HK97 family phage prohead protease [Pirellulales bacterium]